MTEPIDYSKIKEENENFISIFTDIFINIPWKLNILLLLIYIILYSDIFIDKIVARVPGLAESGKLTNKGIITLGIVFIICMNILLLLFRFEKI